METAKVDIRRLQMLNDRINQTLDALNQVRLSVHGISHSSVAPGSPFAGGQFGQFAGSQFSGTPYGATPWGTTPYGVPFGAYPYGPQSHVPGMPGISHSSPFTSPTGFPYAAVNPVMAQQWALGGLSHTSPESIDPSMASRSPVGFDPYYVQRMAQTFPFAQWGYSPFSYGIG